MAKEPKTRKCKQCGKVKVITDFKRTTNGFTKNCKDCISINRMNNKSNIKHENFYVYRFLDKNNRVIYVGKTININNRMQGHILKANDLYEELYKNIHKIEYSEVPSNYHMDIYEIHYICKYKPKYNIQFASDNTDLFDLPELEWSLYILNKYTSDFCKREIMCYGIDSKDTLKKLEQNKDFYNQFIDEYTNTDYINKQFNREEYVNIYY